MLIRFRSPAHHDILMFGTAAVSLLELLGVSGRVPSALQAVDLPAARDRLLLGLERQVALAAEADPAEDKADAGEQDGAPTVTLRQRALPLLAMIDSAIAGDTWVMWEAAN